MGWDTVLIFGPGRWQSEVGDTTDMIVNVCLLEATAAVLCNMKQRRRPLTGNRWFIARSFKPAMRVYGFLPG